MFMINMLSVTVQMGKFWMGRIAESSVTSTCEQSSSCRWTCEAKVSGPFQAFEATEATSLPALPGVTAP